MKSKCFAWLCIAAVLVSLWGCDNAAFDNEATEDYKRHHPSAFQVNVFLRDISPDNNTLLFQYGSPYWLKIGIYSMSTEIVHVFNNDGENKINDAPSFSRDGKKIVFIGAKERDYARNIYIMNADGSGLRQITKNAEVKGDNIIHAHAPSFSPDGKRIIFLRSQRTRERAFPLRGSMHADWDVYEVDVETGVERKLTNYNFYEASRPNYLSDGKRFIFSGEGPYNPTGRGPKDFKEYENQYQKNFIFIMDGTDNDLKPALTNGGHSYRPSISNNDEVLFISKTNEMDGLGAAQDTQDLFLYKEGKITRMTKFHAYIQLAKISRDGKRILFSKKKDRRSRDDSHWVMNSDGTGLREIKIPVDSLKQ